MKFNTRAVTAALLLGVSPGAVLAEVVAPTTPPPAPAFDAQGEPVFVNRADIYTYRALESYAEPEYMAAFVAAGLLPPGVGQAAANAYRELRRSQHRARLDEKPTQFPAATLAAERDAVMALWQAVFAT